ncbi:MAG: NAD(P)H-dependent oxidoreductase [Reichenbachiella sp.]|uniref:FMN-dependent NADH-azoreductase n=1 Tax=Reichenbachiella sp. TaxID=2184521 RepID=UPI003267878D
MQTLLRIDSSSRVEGSHSRELGDYFEKRWKAAHPKGQVIHRDLVSSVLPHIHNDTIEGFYTAPEALDERKQKATKLSDHLISELKSADELLITSPLYNLNVPSNLKAYFDQVTRIGRTFMVQDGEYKGLLLDKVAYIVTAKGGSYQGTPMEAYDFQGPYLTAILHHVGIPVRKIFNLEGTADQGTLVSNKIKLTQSIDSMFNHKNLAYEDYE